MDTNRGLWIGLILLIGVGILGAIALFAEAPATEVPQEEVAMVPYNVLELGVSFEYPDTYTLQSHEVGNDERNWQAVTLIDTEALQSAIENGASEGPPAITVSVFDNIENYTAEEWIKGISFSNYKLSFDGALASTTVGSIDGLAYRYSGLFEVDTVVLAHNGKIYMFTADWLTAEDTLRLDFGRVLDTVVFAPVI